MSSKLITKDNLANMLAQSRNEANKTQKYMAKSLDKSVATIQNWESGYATPNLIDMLEWFECLGLNPLSYVLNFLHPDEFTVNLKNDDETTRALNYYINNIATESDRQRLAYCILSNTGSSWTAQLNMLTAHNHVTMRSRINAAQTVYDSYMIEKARGELIQTDSIMPDEENLRYCIEQGRQSVYNGKQGYIGIKKTEVD